MAFKDRNRLIFWACAGGILFALPAFSGSVLAPVKKEPPLLPGESYPESRFGRPPVRVDTGVSSGYAARATTELDEAEESGEPILSASRASGGGRAPAGLEIGAGKSPSPESNSPHAGNPARGGEVEASSTASSIARKGVQEVALIAGDLGFFPKTFFVSRDVPVRLFVTGASKNTLCIMMDSFQVRKQVRSQKIEEITFTPGAPGRYRFYCPVNGMEGTMIVRELASAGSN